MEGESSTSNHNTKVSDSAYSNSCSNSQSQRSGSSKSRLSGSHSSGSSGYGGKPSTQASSNDLIFKRNKDKSRKKKKAKCSDVPGTLELSDEQVVASTSSTIIAKQQQQLQQERERERERESMDQQETPANEAQQHSEQQLEDVAMTQQEPQQSLEQAHQLLPGSTSNQQMPQLAINISNNILSIGAASLQESPCGPGLSMTKADKTCESALLKLDTGMPPSSLHAKQPMHDRKEDTFCCVISMHDGVVLYTTPSISDILGFPRDMWLGRSFIDFVHQKDRATFASQITTGIPIDTGRGGTPKEQRSTFCVMLRRYRGLNATGGGFGVIGRSVNYEPFRLGLTFREAPEEANGDNYKVPNGTNMLLVISATPIKSSYKVPDEILSNKSPKFSIRHTATGIISHVDSASVSALGYLPQDLIGRSILDFYHHEDLSVMKETYETVMKKGQNAGASFCSKPYRFLIQNGCYVLLETEWTSFVNPWSRKLEFVVGHHRVFQGPKQCNVFEQPPGTKIKISEEAQNRNSRIKEDILKLLSEIVSRPSDTVKQEVSRRCQALASFMETLMDEVTRTDLKLELPVENELTVSERDSVMLGEISPHHDYYDSKSSTETPPSYNQLNYNENLLRFFNSKPVTAPAELDPPKLESAYMSSAREDARSTSSPVHGFEGSGGSGSSGNCTTGSNIHMSSVTNTNTSITGTGTGTTSGGGNSHGNGNGNGNTNPTCNGNASSLGGGTAHGHANPNAHGHSSGNGSGHGGSGHGSAVSSAPTVSVTLTESLLNKHNDEMEKFMIKKHRESRGRTGEKNKKSANEKMLEYSGPGHGGHGVKRGGSHSWEGDANKPKQQLTLNSAIGVGSANLIHEPHVPIPIKPQLTNAPALQCNQFTQSNLNCTQNINLWPPFSVGVTTPTVQHAHTAVAQSSFSPQPSLFPAFYYIPAAAAQPAPNPPMHSMQRPLKLCDQPTTSQQAAAAATAAAHAAMPLQYMAGVMYPHPSLFYTHPAAAAATAMMYQPMPFSSVANVMQMSNRSSSSQTSYNKVVYNPQPSMVAPLTCATKPQGAFHSITPSQLQRPSSQATSVKAEPGSNVAPSDTSKKEVNDSPIPSVMGEVGYGSDQRSHRTHNKKYTDSNGNSDDMDGSSFSSFYSSFIKTTDGSESPPDNDKDSKRKTKSSLRRDSKIVEHPEEDQTQHGDG
ncbi:per [Drosophila busckii]|uniref:Period circadian protein n=1 Tax=Drosophila busckii TaxID=30019 RepID=A0A0M4FAQ1_DROBS|nr:period circadian protein isoform X2 [Drosophila busckii]ALC49900.1 per [Drosophila busckii]